MHDLTPITALGAASAQVDTFDHVTIAENTGLALASVAARLGQEAACHGHLTDLLGGVPAPGRAILRDPEAGFWIGPDQWMVGAPRASHPDLAAQLKNRFDATASITDQTGAWVTFDVTGSAMPDVCERLCAVPIRTMQAGDAPRTMLHQIRCFVIKRTAPDHIRILGPRASAGSLHHALVTAAISTRP